MSEPLAQVVYHLTHLPHLLHVEKVTVNEVASFLFAINLTYHGVAFTHHAVKHTVAKVKARRALKARVPPD